MSRDLECDYCGKEVAPDETTCSPECEEAREGFHRKLEARTMAKAVNAKVPGIWDADKGRIKERYKAALRCTLLNPRARKIKRLKGVTRVYTGLLNKGVQPYKVAYDFKEEFQFIAAGLKEAYRCKAEVKVDEKARFKVEGYYFELPTEKFKEFEDRAKQLI